jgi:hypothetical protein
MISYSADLIGSAALSPGVVLFAYLLALKSLKNRIFNYATETLCKL